LQRAAGVELLVGERYAGKVCFIQPQDNWWEEGRPDKPYDPGRAGVRWMKVLYIDGCKDSRKGSEYSTVFVTTSNPVKHGWREGSEVVFGVEEVGVWMEVRKKGGNVGKAKVVRIQEVRPAPSSDADEPAAEGDAS